MLNEEKPEITQAVEKMLNRDALLRRGRVLTYEEINRETGFNRFHPSWNTFQRKLRRKLVELYGIATRAINNVGYRLLEAEEQVVRCARDRSQRASRQYFRAKKEVASVQPEGLSDHMRRMQAIQIDTLHKNRNASIRSVRSLNKEVKPTETLPKRFR